MKLKSFAIVLGLALLAAVLTSLFDKQLGFMVFFGVAASMSIGEIIDYRHRRKVAMHLSKTENALTEAMQTMQATLAVAQATGDIAAIQAASRALAATGALRTDVQSLRADLA